MIKDLSLHGVMGPVEFFAYVRGADTKGAYFYEESPSGIRFFSRGNEFTISKEGIHYKGTGGSFCDYMFGVEKPLEDFTNRDVLNRLVMFGAFADKNGSLLFTNNVNGSNPFQRLFLQGHAVRNYCFIVSSSYEGAAKKRQKQILGKVGKLLKRTVLIEDGMSSELIEEFYERLDEPHSTVFIFELVHKGNEEFYKAYRNFYFKNKTLTGEEENKVYEIVSRNGIDYYQQERMKIDVMYRHAENKYIVDEYRDILLSSIHTDSIEHSELARLRRLKTLRIRNNIPAALFETLDEFLLKGKKIEDIEETEYLREARSILQNLFFINPSLKSHIIGEDIVRLIKAKNSAYSEGDMGFEKILLDVGKTCDETARETNDYSLFEEFSSIVTYFDRYDHVQASMSKVAFTESIELTEDFLRSLLGNKKEFDDLEHGLFRELFVRALLSNKYITKYGKKKIEAILDGIDKVSKGDASLKDVVSVVGMVVEEERLYRLVHIALKEKLRSFYPRLDAREGRDEIRGDIEAEFRDKGVAAGVSEELFEKVFLDMKKESFYINHLLPEIIKTTDKDLREDFLKNSGLDRFYIENIEKDYFEERGLDMFLLNLIREDTDLLNGEGIGLI
ncbi:MAG: TIGR04442 family protein [Thermodesulfovibrionales bacterium]|nr:TIGR04442 family protein [Thermodesulfovibrionales bacterium]